MGVEGSVQEAFFEAAKPQKLYGFTMLMLENTFSVNNENSTYTFGELKRVFTKAYTNLRA